MAATIFGAFLILLLMSRRMFVLATLMGLLQQVSDTPYVTGGDSASGTDCSGLASWVSNMATDRPVFGDRFNTGNEESALLARDFKFGTAPGAVVIGWNGRHTAVTLPDGTPVSSGERRRRENWCRRGLPAPVHSSHVPPGGSRRTRRCPTAATRPGSGGRVAPEPPPPPAPGPDPVEPVQNELPPPPDPAPAPDAPGEAA
jgi:hypothetical protein